MSSATKNANRLPDLTKICRICLAEESGTINIFDSDSNTNIALQIVTCTALELHAIDALPKQICRECRIQLERSYFFRKKSQISDAKLRKHIRLINAGKKSRVFEPKTEKHDDDDNDELKNSRDFLEQIEKEELEKQQQRHVEMEETIRQRLREEEMDSIFEEAKNFFISKISDKRKRKAGATDNARPAKVQPSTSVSSEEKSSEQQSNSIDEDVVVDSTDIPFSENVDGEEINKNTCYVVKMGSDNETEFEIQENSPLDDETDNLGTYTVVKVEVDNAQGVTYGSLNFKHNLESNEVEMDQNSDDYNDEQAAFTDENSNSSNPHIFTIAAASDTEQEDLDQQTDEIVIDMISKGAEYLEDDLQIAAESDDQKKNQIDDRSNMIEVNNPKNIEELKIFKCQHCPQAFTRRAQLARHVHVHEKVRGFQCDDCKKWFACKSSLDRHRRVHTGEKPFQCEVCMRRFIQKEILKRHLAIHTGERPFPCPHCNKSFVQRQMLASHINLKHTDNPVIQMHECFLCPKTFCHASGLSRHLLTHSGVTYTCVKCGKKFSDKSAVKRHTASVH